MNAVSLGRCVTEAMLLADCPVAQRALSRAGKLAISTVQSGLLPKPSSLSPDGHSAESPLYQQRSVKTKPVHQRPYLTTLLAAVHIAGN